MEMRGKSIPDNVGALFMANGSLEASEKLEDRDFGKKTNVYEVVRIIRGIPLFFEDHYSRLKKSLDLLGMEIKIPRQELRKKISELIEANGQQNCNVKILVYPEADRQDSIMYISKSFYPGSNEIEKGVKTALLHFERDNPNIKIGDDAYKEMVSKKIEESGVFEVVLVNAMDKITEGSKSNIFFVNGSRVFTAPDEYVLKGVTRQQVLNVCKKLDLEVIETLISVHSLAEIEGVFLSGTSIKVLPVSRIDSHDYRSATHPTITVIREQYDRLVEEYLNNNK
ncbi:MAG: aminotransferase class IV [Clostridiales bacterium]|nr:aminotransferase class IV [Eubacteriales bacterium]MDH7565793.1 aminotransferase class IV [Clostridiales bacterium]